ncbi:MAG: flagellar basal body P-ring formation protein FlgA [Candidatus Polarisedimenticolaceae bacterium]|nr:flagellar basal body P-ring formation protein FlgA [Candidatus Polarisedimenticolaceae bacterium]
MSSNHEDRVITIGRLDSRLRLKQCDKPLSTFSPPGRQTTGRTTVGVRCEGSKPWTIYVSAQVGIIEQIVVANRNIPRGTRLTAGDLRLDARDTTKLHRGYLTEISQAVNKTITKMVRRDTPISPNKISASLVIKRGTEVTILSHIGTIEVRMKGTALGSGAIGDRIKVRNNRSKRQINALIISSRLVRVD